MGRAQSLIGLARSHAMLNNTKKADYFYQYIVKQMQSADDNNLFVKEAKIWLASGGDSKGLREQWLWPYL